YRDPAAALCDIPTLAQLTCDTATLRRRAVDMRRSLDDRRVDVVASEASVGGGAFPTARIPSIALSVDGTPALVEARLRAGEPALVARIADNRTLIDLRTVFSDDDALVIELVRTALR